MTGASPRSQQANRSTDYRWVERAVRTLELFFDLVFVFTITQVTSILAASPTTLGPCTV